MSETMKMMPGEADPKLDSEFSGMKTVVISVLALWLGLVVFLGAQGAFVGSPDLPPLRIFLGLAIPLAVFFTAYSKWGAFRAFILGADLRLVVAIQAWRWAGVGFLTLYTKGALPGLFAFPAGLGDMAVGFTAPWMVLNLVRQKSFATSRRFVMWNIMGIFDFVVAVSVATLCSGAFHGMNGFIGNITTSSMSQLPLVLIPAFMVPLFTMLHCTALFQARRAGAEEHSTPNI